MQNFITKKTIGLGLVTSAVIAIALTTSAAANAAPTASLTVTNPSPALNGAINTVTLNGAEFTPNDQVTLTSTITNDAIGYTTSSAPVATDPAGAFTGASIAVSLPFLTADQDLVITATDTQGTTAHVVVDVVMSQGIGADSFSVTTEQMAAPGRGIVIYGGTFAPGSTITVSVDQSFGPWPTFEPFTITADRRGGFITPPIVFTHGTVRAGTMSVMFQSGAAVKFAPLFISGSDIVLDGPPVAQQTPPSTAAPVASVRLPVVAG